MGGILLAFACVAGFALGLPGAVAIVATGLALRCAGKTTTAWVIVVLAAMLLGKLRAVDAPMTESPDWSDEATAVRGIVVTGPMSTRAGQRFNIEVEEVRIGSTWQAANAVACVSASDPPELRRGDRAYLAVSSVRIDDLPQGVAHALAASGCAVSLTAWRTTKLKSGDGVLYVIDGIRRSMANRLQDAAPGDAGSLLAGLVTGDDGALSIEAREAFVETGTTHITAVSGSNIALVVVFLVSLGGRFGVHRRFAWQVATAGGVWFYALLVGLQPPALRAALVATGAVFAVSFGRRPDLVTLTMVAAALQLLFRPSDYWTLSFRLSFVSALALALVLQGRSGAGALGLLKAGLIATAAAQIATIPVLITTFGQLSPLSLPTNVLIAPLVEVAFPVAFVAGLVGFVSVALGDAVATLGALSASLILRIVDLMAGIQGAPITVSTPRLLGNAIVAAASIVAIALLSQDCRRAIRRARGSRRVADRPRLVLAGLGCVGFLIGLSLGAAR
ncbi:MAG TPA: ComEC/Rec2 family competence protein [Thermomicrobiales bacterium]